MKKQGYVYILSSKEKDGALYIGVTSNLIKRVYEHKHDVVDGFSKKYKTHKLVYYEISDSIESAIMREKQLKKWRREKKEALIETMNPERKDLWEEII